MHVRDLLERTNEHLLYECDDRTRWNLCIPTLNFIDFMKKLMLNKLIKNACRHKKTLMFKRLVEWFESFLLQTMY